MREEGKRIGFEKYRGKEILVFDYSHLESVEAAYKYLDEAVEFCAQLPIKSALAVTDVTGSPFDLKVVEAMKQASKKNAPYVRASATTGITGLKKVILPIVAKFSGRDYRAFETRKEAMDWLITQ